MRSSLKPPALSAVPRPARSSCPSALSIEISTRAWLPRFRLGEPAKITSDMAPPRTFLAEWVPSTHARASTTFDLPDPLGPTMTVMPGSTSIAVRSANDLKPRIDSDLRNTRPPGGAGRHGGRDDTAGGTMDAAGRRRAAAVPADATGATSPTDGSRHLVGGSRHLVGGGGELIGRNRHPVGRRGFLG